MLPAIFDKTTIPILEQVVRFAQARHDVLAGNVANMDTPGYTTRDLSTETFQTRLREAIEARKQAPQFDSPGLRSLRPEGTIRPEVAMQRVRDAAGEILHHDESNVSLEQQVAEITKNFTMHNLAISVMNSQYRLLQTVISERV